MNIHNDRAQNETVPQLDPFQLLTVALFAGLAMSTFVLCALPLLYAESRFPQPWPKIVGLVGAALAVFALEAPIPWVAVAFSMGLVFSDQVQKGKNLWGALGSAVLVAIGISLVLFFFQMNIQGGEPLTFWRDLVHSLVTEVQGSFKSDTAADWALLEKLIYEEAPFLVGGLAFVSAWLSLGAAVHFGWGPGEPPLASAQLRDSLELPVWLSALATAAFFVSLVVPLPFYVSGIARFLCCLLFMQGTLFLSSALARRNVARGRRTWVYGISVVFGFYALIVLGMVRVFKRKKR